MNPLFLLSAVWCSLAILRLLDVAFPEKPLSWQYYTFQLAVGGTGLILTNHQW